MSDGVKLRTIVFKHTTDPAPKPVILLRTPYLYKDGKFRSDRFEPEAKYYESLGYHFVLQAIRGTHGSEGEFKLLNPMEINDGYDTLKWITEQEFSNGNIGVSGVSYEGFTALAAGIKFHPALKVIFAAGSPTNIFTDYFVQNGVLDLNTLDYLRYCITGEGWASTPGFSKLTSEIIQVPNLLVYDDILFNRSFEEWKVIAKNYPDPNAALWKERQIFDQLKEIRTPTYHIAGLRFDGNSSDVIRNFQEIERHSKYKKNHNLILGYWDHGDFLPHDESYGNTFMKQQYESALGYYLKGAIKTIEHSRVTISSNFNDKYLSGDAFPLTSFKYQKLYLNRDNKNSFLSSSFKSKEESSKYAFLPFENNNWDGIQNLDFKYEVTKQMPLLGTIEIEVFIRINTPQTDIMFFFYKQTEDGKMHYYGCRPAQKVIGSDNGIQKIKLATCPIRDLLNPGDKLGFEISSNNFPTRVRNRNNPIAGYFVSFTKAEVEVLHSEKYPSSIILMLEN